jgi:hypothetical protein
MLVFMLVFIRPKPEELPLLLASAARRVIIVLTPLVSLTAGGFGSTQVSLARFLERL